MEQNAMTRFHHSLAATSAFLGIVLLNLGSPFICWSEEGAAPRFSALFDPAKGFKPVQPNLTEIFLQIAGSLEATGSPEGYIRHMQAEHKRVTALWEKATGKKASTRMPTHLTEAYLAQFLKNWKALSKPLGLDAFAKDIGHCVREGIVGTRDTGTIAVAAFNQHQREVMAMMRGELKKPVGFEDLQKRLERDLEFDRETLDTTGYTIARRDAVDYAAIIDGKFKKQLRKVDAFAKPEVAASMKRALVGFFMDLGYLAESELEIAIMEDAVTEP